jgi:hypothetical protein
MCTSITRAEECLSFREEMWVLFVRLIRASTTGRLIRGARGKVLAVLPVSKQFPGVFWHRRKTKSPALRNHTQNTAPSAGCLCNVLV